MSQQLLLKAPKSDTGLLFRLSHISIAALKIVFSPVIRAFKWYDNLEDEVEKVDNYHDVKNNVSELDTPIQFLEERETYASSNQEGK